jgi:Peptidase C65 Otubain
MVDYLQGLLKGDTFGRNDTYSPRDSFVVFNPHAEDPTAPVKTISKTWMSFESLRDELKYNPVYQKNIWELNRNYSAWRKVRGDGNCYYRAVISSYMLKIFHFASPKVHIFQLIALIQNIPMKGVDEIYLNAKNYIKNYLVRLYSQPRTLTNLIEIFKKVNQDLQDEEFDLNLIRVARLISYLAIKDNQKFSNIAPFFIDNDIDSLSEGILTMGREAEGIELALLPLGLEIYVRQINIFEKILINTYPDETLKDNTIMVNIICKMRGHYDMIYEIEEMEYQEYCIQEGAYYYDPNWVPLE